MRWKMLSNMLYEITPHYARYVLQQKKKWGGGGLRNSWSMKMGSQELILDTLELTFVGIRGVSGTRYAHALPKDGCLACTLAGRGQRWSAWTERNFGKLWSPEWQKCKICMAPKNGDALEPKKFCHLWKWYAPERVENGGLSRSTYLLCNIYESSPPGDEYDDDVDDDDYDFYDDAYL